MSCLDDNALAAFVARELADTERSSVVEHLDGCDTCMTIACAIARATDPVEADVRVVPIAGSRVAGRYRLDSMIGRGAMGAVYIATDAQLGRQVAIKIVRSTAGLRSSREARAMAQVKHPNVVTVFDAGDLEVGVFIVMELVIGDTLADWLVGDRDWREVVRVFEAAGRGLAAAHAAGIVHRDFKPANVLVDRCGRVCVTDFGLAFAPPSITNPDLVVDVALTRTGSVLGTPQYMAPEQHRGHKADARADQFSFAIALYEALYHQPPFERSTHAGLREAVLAGDLAARPSTSPVPVAIDRVLRRALATDPAARYPTISRMLDDLVVAARPARQRRLVWVAALAAVAGLGAIGFVVGRSGDREPDTTPPLERARRAVLLFEPVDNLTREPRLDGTIELAVDAVVSDSTKLDTYSAASLEGLAGSLYVPAKPTEPIAAALEARDHALAFVVSQSVTRDGRGFAIEVEVHAADHEPIVFHETAPDLDGILAAAVRVGVDLRVRFGDITTAGVHVMSRSLDAVYQLAAGNRLSASGDFLVARVHLLRAIEADPDFAAAHAVLGGVYYNLLKLPEAAAELELALRDHDRMPERKRLALMADYYGASGRFVESIAASEQLLAKWPGEMRSEVNVVATALDAEMFPLALELARRAAVDHPQVVVARSNLVIADLATGKLDDAIRDGAAMLRDLPHPSSYGYVALAMTQALMNDTTAARQTLDRLSADDLETADQGRADLLLYEGRLDDAEAVLHRWIDPRAAKGNEPEARAELMTLARLLLRRGDKTGARRAATTAVGDNSARGKYLLASMLIEAGDDHVAHELQQAWIAQPSPDSHAYAKLLDGDLARAHGDLRASIAAYRGAGDTWIVHARLGTAELDAGMFAEAITELETCVARRGEGAIFSTPSLSLLPEIYFALARAKSAAHTADAADTYRRLVTIAPSSQHDPITDAARAAVPAR